MAPSDDPAFQPANPPPAESEDLAPDGEPAAGEENAADNAADGFLYTCPRCARRFTEYLEKCPECDTELDEEFSATYQVRMSPAGRTIALILLIGVAVLVVLGLIGLLAQVLGTTPPTEGAVLIS